MKTTIKAGLLLGAAALLIFAQPVLAEEQAAAPPAEAAKDDTAKTDDAAKGKNEVGLLQTMDKNKDAAVSKKEFLAFQTTVFAGMDKDKNGKISGDEIQHNVAADNKLSEQDKAELGRIREECMGKAKAFWEAHGGLPGAPTAPDAAPSAAPPAAAQ